MEAKDKSHQEAISVLEKKISGVTEKAKVDKEQVQRLVAEVREQARLELQVKDKSHSEAMSALQSTVSELMREAKVDKQHFQHQVTEVRQQLIPIGFIYTQLSDQPEPTTMWPSMQWQDISSQYSGLFFRVNGDAAAPMGQVQEQDSPRLTQVQANLGPGLNIQQIGYTHGHGVVSPGSWSPNFWTGSDAGPRFATLKFLLSAGEVRPRNKAIKIWRRVQ